MRTLADLVLIAFCVLGCLDKDDPDLGPMRRTQGGFLISKAAFGVEDVEIDAATEYQFEVLLTKNPSLDRTGARAVLRNIPIRIRDGYAYKVPTRLGYVWVTGDTDGHSYIQVALESYNGGLGGPPYLPALNHEMGHAFFGAGYEH